MALHSASPDSSFAFRGEVVQTTGMSLVHVLAAIWLIAAGCYLAALIYVWARRRVRDRRDDGR